MHACLRRTRKRVARVCEMMSMMGGGDRCECAECPEFLRVVGRRTVTMYVSNGRLGAFSSFWVWRGRGGTPPPPDLVCINLSFSGDGRFFHRVLESSCGRALFVGLRVTSLHRLPPLQPFCSVEPHGC